MKNFLRPLLAKFSPRAETYIVLVGGVILASFLLSSLLANYIAPYDPVNYTSGGRLNPPSREHLMGTDQHGRDMFSRVVFGSRPALMVAFFSAVVALTVGVPGGVLSGFFGGKLDRILALLADSVYAFPSFILAVTIAAMLGPGIINVGLAITVVYIPIYFRVIRSRVFQVREEPYVEAAKALGLSNFSILVKYITPNAISAIIPIIPFNIADAILTETGLSFLGFGIEPPTPDWGFDISNGKRYFLVGKWWTITYPGIMIILVVIGFSLLGEGLNDMLNPKGKKR